MKKLLEIFAGTLFLLLPMFMMPPALRAASGTASGIPVLPDEAAPADSLDRMLDTYLQALEYESLEVKQEECDFLISTCSDRSVRSLVALKIYDHYLHSPFMGEEAVAIHVFDRWFGSGEIEVPDDVRFGAQIFAEFNRQSLLGKKAPALRMRTVAGDSLDLIGPEKPSGRYTVLYFYDTHCPKCFIETTKLPLFFKEDFPVDFYPIYVGVDAGAWAEYRQKFVPREPVKQLRIVDVWDEQLNSDYQRKYGVLQTPRLFLINPLGIIEGRGLDVPTLTAMLQLVFEERKLNYGSAESEQLFDQAFAPYAPQVKGEDVRFVADYIAKSTVEVADTLTYRQLMGDLLYYLIPKRGAGWKEGLSDVIAHHIFGQPKVWDSADDSLKIIGTAQMAADLLALTPSGSRLPALKVPGKLSRGARKADAEVDLADGKVGKYHLRHLGGRRNLILFTTEGCPYCAAEKKAISALLASGKEKNLRVLEVDMDEIFSSYPDLADRLLSEFDLTSMPYLLETDRRGRVLRKYLSLVEEMKTEN